jgi:hypothetical protein
MHGTYVFQQIPSLFLLLFLYTYFSFFLLPLVLPNLVFVYRVKYCTHAVITSYYLLTYHSNNT